MEKVENVHRPLQVGEYFMVPCLVKESTDDLVVTITPIINHPHNDKENGQNYVHFHVDYRFLKHDPDNGVSFPKVINTRKKSKYQFDGNQGRVREHIDGKIEYFVLPVINESFAGLSNVTSIYRSKLKHDCIYKGKCPHRGYDLSQVNSIEGIVTCPLHGLKFDEQTKKIINR